MKAIILAGGRGARLWPLTCERPKPLVPVMGVPVIEHTIRALKRMGITEIGATLGVMAKEITQRLGDGSALGVSLSCFVEERPLGTAGSVKAAERFIGDEDFLVVSGDAIFNLDIDAAVRLHHERRADATILLYRAGDPSQYGVALTDNDMRIMRFVEKPTWAHVYSDAVNTGIYVLKSDVLKLIPPGAPFDFSRDLFPLMLERGANLLGFPADGYWCDIGGPESYLRCHADIFDNVSGIGDAILREDFRLAWDVSRYGEYSEANLIPPVYIIKGANIAPGASIGPFAVIGSGCEIERGARIKESVIGGGVFVGRDAQVCGAVADEASQIGEKAEISEGTVLGARSCVGKGARTQRGALMRCESRIEDKNGGGGLSVTADGAQIALDDDFLPSDAVTFGYALSLANGGGSAAVGSCGCAEAAFIGSLIAAGLLMGGVGVFEMSGVNYGACAHITRRMGLSFGVFTECTGGRVRASVIGEHGLPVSFKTAQQTARVFKRRRLPDFGSLKMRRPCALSDAAALYIDELSRRYPACFGRGVCLTGSGADFETVGRVFERLGIVTNREPGADVYVLSDGHLEIITEKNEVVSGERLMMLSELIYFKEGAREPFPAPWRAVKELETIAERFGGSVARSSMRDDSVDASLRETAAQMLDAAALTCMIACHALAGNIGVDELLRELPETFVSSRSVMCPENSRAGLMRRVVKLAGGGADLGEGVRFSRPGGFVIITPEEGASSLSIYAQGETSEAADELCDFFDGLIRGYIGEDRRGVITG
ncbi:MAG: NTP transferase domain-containing protein [Clostridia bacterium]|nr:NTP transferase domain-containing protein [Clostridia bacterium]